MPAISSDGRKLKKKVIYVYEDEDEARANGGAERVAVGMPGKPPRSNKSLLASAGQRYLTGKNQGQSMQELPVISQNEYFNYNKRDKDGNLIQASDPRPVIFALQKSGEDFKNYASTKITRNASRDNANYKEESDVARSIRREPSFSRRQLMTGSAMVLRASKEDQVNSR